MLPICVPCKEDGKTIVKKSTPKDYVQALKEKRAKANAASAN